MKASGVVHRDLFDAWVTRAEKAEARLKSAEGLLARAVGKECWANVKASFCSTEKPCFACEVRAFRAPEGTAEPPRVFKAQCSDSVNHDHTRSYCAGPWPERCGGFSFAGRRCILDEGHKGSCRGEHTAPPTAEPSREGERDIPRTRP